MVLPGVKIIFLEDQTLNLKEEDLFCAAVKSTIQPFHTKFFSDDFGKKQTKLNFSFSLHLSFF